MGWSPALFWGAVTNSTGGSSMRKSGFSANDQMRLANPGESLHGGLELSFGDRSPENCLALASSCASVDSLERSGREN